MANRTPVRAPARVVFKQSREHFRFDPPNLLLTTLTVVAAVAVVATAPRSTTFTDYNAPQRPVEFQPPNTLLTLLSKPVAAPGVVNAPFNQDDWPNPRGSPVRDLTWTQSPEVIPPVVIPPAQAPFAQDDWPNPRGSPVRDFTWTQTPEVIPQVPDIAVANRIPNQTDWPNPQRPWVRDLTWTQSPAVPPISIPAVPAPFAQEDWPNPQRSQVRDLTWTQTPQAQQVVVPPVTAVTPFDQTDWPNPQRALTRDLTWTQSPRVEQIVLPDAVAEGERAHGFTDYFAKPPPAQFDPPNLLLTLFPPVVVIPAGTEKPFLQADWPNPVLRTPFLESGWIRFANIGDIPARPTPVVVIQNPFSQEDWPNPILRTVRIKTPESYRPPPYDATATTAVVSTPFSQDDWPNPVRRVAQREFGFTRFANISDVPPRIVPPTPFDQTDWPNPIRPWVRDLTWTQTPEVIPQVIPVIVPVPFAQTDWPNPLTPWRRDLTWLQSPQVPQTPPPPPTPFAQDDWPNPLRPWQRDFSWSQSPQVPQVVPDAASNFPPAFVQTDWPNPVLRTPFNESGWVRFANIGDIPAAAPPVPVPPVPTDEVKPSGGRVQHGTVDPEFRYAIEGRKTYAQKLRDLRIAQEAAQVIEQVALQQAATLEVNEVKNARELKKALRLAKIEDDARYLELLAERRELAKNEEIGALLYKAMQDEEDILALLMIAAQLL